MNYDNEQLNFKIPLLYNYDNSDEDFFHDTKLKNFIIENNFFLKSAIKKNCRAAEIIFCLFKK